RRLSTLVEEDRSATAVIVIDRYGIPQRLSRQDLLEASLRTARALRSLNVDTDSLVVVALPNSLEHVVVAYASWWLGPCYMPLSTRLPLAERSQVLHAAATSGRRTVVVDLEDGGDATIGLERLIDLASRMPADELPDVIPIIGRAIPSSGSTGRAKVIVE